MCYNVVSVGSAWSDAIALSAMSMGLLIALPCTALLTILGRRLLQVWKGSTVYQGG